LLTVLVLGRDLRNGILLQLGLNQTDRDIWRERLDAICATDADYATLAEQYIAEDARCSARSDGMTPALGEAVVSLEIVELQTCDRQLGLTARIRQHAWPSGGIYAASEVSVERRQLSTVSRVATDFISMNSRR
jgi:hypothetical protein